MNMALAMLSTKPHDKPLCDLTVSEAAKAMVLNGLECINQVLNDGALGRALATLYDYG
jgi:hypothetical protein